MMSNKSRSQARKRRHMHIRRTVNGTAARPRLSVFRSLSQVYAQVIDDERGQTLAAASTLDHDLSAKLKGTQQSQQAKEVGKLVAERARAKGVAAVVFDRGGYRYQGRVRALAEGAREAGLEF
jgi:large subunit ribosomal protein L18